MTQNQPHISFSTVWQHWLGIAKPKNVVRSTLYPSNIILLFSGIARPSGLGGHTYRWVSAATLGEDQKKKNKRSQLLKQK